MDALTAVAGCSPKRIRANAAVAGEHSIASGIYVEGSAFTRPCFECAGLRIKSSKEGVGSCEVMVAEAVARQCIDVLGPWTQAERKGGHGGRVHALKTATDYADASSLTFADDRLCAGVDWPLAKESLTM